MIHSVCQVKLYLDCNEKLWPYFQDDQEQQNNTETEDAEPVQNADENVCTVLQFLVSVSLSTFVKLIDK